MRRAASSGACASGRRSSRSLRISGRGLNGSSDRDQCISSTDTLRDPDTARVHRCARRAREAASHRGGRRCPPGLTSSTIAPCASAARFASRSRSGPRLRATTATGSRTIPVVSGSTSRACQSHRLRQRVVVYSKPRRIWPRGGATAPPDEDARPTITTPSPSKHGPGSPHRPDHDREADRVPDDHSARVCS